MKTLLSSRDGRPFGLRRPASLARRRSVARAAVRWHCGRRLRVTRVGTAVVRPVPHRGPGQGLGRDITTVRLRRRYGLVAALPDRSTAR